MKKTKKKKLTTKGPSHVKSKRQASRVRSKSRPQKKARSKNLARAKQRLSRRVKKARSNPPRKTARAISLSSSRDRKRLGRWQQKAKPSKRSYGFTSSVKIKSPRKNRMPYTLKFSESVLKQKDAIKLSKAKSSRDKIKKVFGQKIRDKYNALGDSTNNLRLVKLKYSFSLNGKKKESYFSTVLSKIHSEEEAERFMLDTLAEFEKKLESYNASGFSGIKIIGVRLHSYEEAA